MGCAALAAFVLLGCAGSVQTRIVTAVNAAEIPLVSVYKSMADECIAAAPVTAAGYAQARACIAANDAKWGKVWTALDAVRAADDKVSAWCALLALAVPLLPDASTVPAIDGVVCGASDGGAS
jgi:hypothetical protein